MVDRIAPLASRALIRVAGPDWRSFLQGLITQDVETLRPDEMRYGALLTPQGRLLYDLFISGDDEGGVLDVSAGVRNDLIAKLTLYRLRAKVRIEAIEAQVVACWDTPAPEVESTWFVDPRHPSMGFRRYARIAEYPEGASETAYDTHRLALGVADPAKDCVEADYPIEANLDLLHGIDFKKGCFVGQETTSRMHRRGVVKTRMAPITFEGPPPAFEAEILAGDRRAGEVRAGMECRAMALLRIDRSRGPLTCEGRLVVLDPPPWLAPVFQQTVDETPQS